MLKKHLSVWMLLNRFTLWKIVLLCIMMAGAECILFYERMCRELQYAEADLSWITLENVIQRSHISWAFAAAFILLTVILSVNTCAFSSKCGYTLSRLSISKKTVFVWHAVHNACCYLLFWTFQTLLSMLFCIWFAEMAEIYITNQSVFLALYRSDFLHALLPLEDLFMWLKNFLLCIGLGITSAVFSCRQREGKFGADIPALACVSLLWFVTGLGNVALDALCLVFVFWLSASAVHYVFTNREESDEKN